MSTLTPDPEEPIYDHDPLVDEALDDDEFDPERDNIIRAKWSMDGATTLSEAAVLLREFASSLEAMEAEGWQLTAPVNDDYGYIHKAELAEGLSEEVAARVEAARGSWP